MQFMRLLGPVVAVSIAVTLASCSANNLPALTASMSTEGAASGAAYPPIGGAKAEGNALSLRRSLRHGLGRARGHRKTRPSPMSWRRVRCPK